MLDTARNYFPVDVIMRQLDAMSWVKVNYSVFLSVRSTNADYNRNSKMSSIGILSTAKVSLLSSPVSRRFLPGVHTRLKRSTRHPKSQMSSIMPMR